jgi:HlyD family secretion protein
VGEAFAIHSPVSGKVLRKFEESSRVVTPGLPLVEIGDPREMEVEIDVLSADAAVIRPGATVWLHQWGQELPLEARVRLVEPAGFTKISALGVEEQRVNVIADFVGPPAARERLGDAYRVEAKIVVWDSPRVLKIPAGCLFRSGREWGVYVADGGRAALRMVEIGHQSGDEAEVLKGLAVGDLVILHPSDKLADGTHIESRAAE